MGQFGTPSCGIRTVDSPDTWMMRLKKTTQYSLLWLIFKPRYLQKCQSQHNDIAPDINATTRRKQISIRIFRPTKLCIYYGWATDCGNYLDHYQASVYKLLNIRVKGKSAHKIHTSFVTSHNCKSFITVTILIDMCLYLYNSQHSALIQ
jgi:hypothetical protein